MKSNSNSVMVYQDKGIDVKIKLSALWITLMLFYIYADILGFYSPGVIGNVMAGEIAGIQLTEGYLLIMAIWMAVPSLMVILSLTVRAKINRWLNLIFGILSLFVLGVTFFVGDFSIRYALQAIIEAALMVMIAWYAWKWPKAESVDNS